MKLTDRYLLVLNKNDQKRVLSAMRECAKLWNDLIDITQSERKSGHWITDVEMQKLVQSQYNLHSDTITALCQRMYANIKTALELRKENPKIEFPYIKKELVTIDGKKKQVLKGNYISLNKSVKIKVSEEVDLSTTNLFHIVTHGNSFYIFVTLKLNSTDNFGVI